MKSFLFERSALGPLLLNIFLNDFHFCVFFKYNCLLIIVDILLYSYITYSTLHITQNTTLHYTVLHSTNTFLLLTYSRNDNNALDLGHLAQAREKPVLIIYEWRSCMWEERGKACPGALAVCSAGPNTETRNYMQKVLMFCFKNLGLHSHFQKTELTVQLQNKCISVSSSFWQKLHMSLIFFRKLLVASILWNSLNWNPKSFEILVNWKGFWCTAFQSTNSFCSHMSSMDHFFWLYRVAFSF